MAELLKIRETDLMTTEMASDEEVANAMASVKEADHSR